MTLLEADNLHLWRGDQHVLSGVSFSVAAGECLQVVGANGVGKSSLLRAVVGLLPLEAGNVRWRGSVLTRDRGAMHRELAWLGHGNGLKADLTPEENLRYALGTADRSAADGHDALRSLAVPVGSQRLTRQLSAGQQRRASLARVQLSQATLWVLDEPTSNLDAAGQQHFAGLLSAHLEQGGAALIATHLALHQHLQRLRTLELK